MSLMSVAELEHRLGDARLRVVDTRWYLLRPGDGRREFDAGHIPGAIHLDLDTDLSAPGDGRHPLPSPSAFVERLEAAGVGSDHTIVAYDDAGGTVAARLWWMLDNLGHEDARVLDGGIAAWLAAGNELTTEVRVQPRARLAVRREWRNTIERAELAERLAEVTLLDARAPERYRGDVEPIDAQAGHIPSAVNAPTTSNLRPDGRFLDATELRRRHAEFARDVRPVVSSCGSGVTACHNILAARLAGLPEPLLYVGSFSDWSSAGMPVAKGDEPDAVEATSRMTGRR